MKYRALNDWALVKLDIVEKTEGGIAIPEIYAVAKRIGTVLSAGKLCTEIKEGSRVLLPNYLGEPMPGDDGTLIREKDILAEVTE
jgi:co-chaperonin GroES (HSP10)